MTDKDISDWIFKRDLARAIENQKDREIALQKIYDDKDSMMMTCIAHQSKRGKEQGEKIDEIMRHHNAMVQSHQTFQQMLTKEQGEKEGYKKILNALKWLVALGGGGGVGAVITKFFGGC